MQCCRDCGQSAGLASSALLCCRKTGKGQYEKKGDTAPEPTELLPPAKGRWLAKEHAKWHRELKTDIAMLLKDGKEQIDLVEAFCSPTLTMTKTAQNVGLKAERWTKKDVDLSKPSGCQLAMERLKELKPKRLWLPQSVDFLRLYKMPTKEHHNRREPSERRGSSPLDSGKVAFDSHGYKLNLEVHFILSRHTDA